MTETFICRQCGEELLEQILGLLSKPGLDPTDEITRELAFHLLDWHQAAVREELKKFAEKVKLEIDECGAFCELSTYQQAIDEVLSCYEPEEEQTCN